MIIKQHILHSRNHQVLKLKNYGGKSDREYDYYQSAGYNTGQGVIHDYYFLPKLVAYLIFVA